MRCFDWKDCAGKVPAPLRARRFYKSALLVACLLAAGCRHEQPNITYMPDMTYGPALKPQQLGNTRSPVAGTVPRGYQPYAYAQDPDAAGLELKNPLRPTRAVLKRGQHIFNSFCIVCHGPEGKGNGYIVPKFPMPPSLHSEKLHQWPDGRIFHVITMGQGLMSSYASQIDPGDRWSVIHYVRVLQRSQNPLPEDLQLLDQESQ